MAARVQTARDAPADDGRAPNEASRAPYVVGVMKIPVDTQDADFDVIVDGAVAALGRRLTEGKAHLTVQLSQFPGPHLTPVEGAYAPLDFLQIGVTEKLERRLDFLLIVTEVDLAATGRSYVLALPSQLTNIGIISTKRLDPRFWGRSPDRAVTERRLLALMLHTLGHLLNLPHVPDEANIMSECTDVDGLDRMTAITFEQAAAMRGNLPRAARERVADAGAWWVALGWLAANARAIARAVLHANPLRLALRQPTMITAGFSVLMVLFFTAEIWDVASTVALVELAVFSLAALVVATAVLNRAVSLRSGAARSKRMAESTVVARAATTFSLFATMAVLYAAFFAFVLLAALTFFPHQLRSTWPTVKPATRLTDEVQIAMFLAAMGVLSGSRGGAAERKALIRHVLFVDEET